MKKVKIPKWKRIIDLACITLTCPTSIILMAMIAIYIKIVSRGPVFFKQERIGFNCEPFICYKFRSMKYNVETKTHQNYFKNLVNSNKPMTKIDNSGDSRLIPGAKLLRATGLDELPQLINVLLGNMSIVGPRPCIRYEYEQYEDWHKERFNTLPGITGLWQVSGKNKTTFNKMMELDIDYVNNLSPLTDIKIIANTIPSMINQAIESDILIDKRESSIPATV